MSSLAEKAVVASSQHLPDEITATILDPHAHELTLRRGREVRHLLLWDFWQEVRCGFRPYAEGPLWQVRFGRRSLHFYGPPLFPEWPWLRHVELPVGGEKKIAGTRCALHPLAAEEKKRISLSGKRKRRWQRLALVLLLMAGGGTLAYRWNRVPAPAAPVPQAAPPVSEAPEPPQGEEETTAGTPQDSACPSQFMAARSFYLRGELDEARRRFRELENQKVCLPELLQKALAEHLARLSAATTGAPFPAANEPRFEKLYREIYALIPYDPAAARARCRALSPLEDLPPSLWELCAGL